MKGGLIFVFLLGFVLIGNLSFISGQEFIGCTDTDSGKGYYTKAVVNGLKSAGIADTLTDYCGTGQEEGKLIEYFCEPYTQYGRSITYECPNGCSDGACIPDQTSTCTDSDGKNYFTK